MFEQSKNKAGGKYLVYAYYRKTAGSIKIPAVLI